MCSVSVETECNKPRQTSRPVIGTEIQTSYNFEHYQFLDYVFGFSVSASAISFFWNSPIWLWFGTLSCFTGFSNRDLLLYQDFVYPPSSPKSNTRAYSTTEPNKSTEHREIQEGSVHCTAVAVHASRLLSTICNSGNFDHSN